MCFLVVPHFGLDHVIIVTCPLPLRVLVTRGPCVNITKSCKKLHAKRVVFPPIILFYFVLEACIFCVSKYCVREITPDAVIPVSAVQPRVAQRHKLEDDDNDLYRTGITIRPLANETCFILVLVFSGITRFSSRILRIRIDS